MHILESFVEGGEIVKTVEWLSAADMNYCRKRWGQGIWLNKAGVLFGFFSDDVIDERMVNEWANKVLNRSLVTTQVKLSDASNLVHLRKPAMSGRGKK